MINTFLLLFLWTDFPAHSKDVIPVICIDKLIIKLIKIQNQLYNP